MTHDLWYWVLAEVRLPILSKIKQALSITFMDIHSPSRCGCLQFSFPCKLVKTVSEECICKHAQVNMSIVECTADMLLEHWAVWYTEFLFGDVFGYSRFRGDKCRDTWEREIMMLSWDILFHNIMLLCCTLHSHPTISSVSLWLNKNDFND